MTNRRTPKQKTPPPPTHTHTNTNIFCIIICCNCCCSMFNHCLRFLQDLRSRKVAFQLTNSHKCLTLHLHHHLPRWPGSKVDPLIGVFNILTSAVSSDHTDHTNVTNGAPTNQGDLALRWQTRMRPLIVVFNVILCVDQIPTILVKQSLTLHLHHLPTMKVIWIWNAPFKTRVSPYFMATT